MDKNTRASDMSASGFSGPDPHAARQSSTTPILDSRDHNADNLADSPNGSRESSGIKRNTWQTNGKGNVPRNPLLSSPSHDAPLPGESGTNKPDGTASKLNGSSNKADGELNSYGTDDSSENGDGHDHGSDNWDAMRQVMSNMFGRSRQAASEEEKTRHVGIVWKNLTVRGVGLGATIQPTISDIFLAIPRGLWNLLRHGPRRKKGKALRTIIDDFNGCVKPGEMLLVLGQPGSGCSTLLKVLGTSERDMRPSKVALPMEGPILRPWKRIIDPKCSII